VNSWPGGTKSRCVHTAGHRAAHEYQVYPCTRVRYPWENPRTVLAGIRYLVPETQRVQVSILENSGTCDRYLCFLASKYGHDISRKIVFLVLTRHLLLNCCLFVSSSTFCYIYSLFIQVYS